MRAVSASWRVGLGSQSAATGVSGGRTVPRETPWPAWASFLSTAAEVYSLVAARTRSSRSERALPSYSPTDASTCHRPERAGFPLKDFTVAFGFIRALWWLAVLEGRDLVEFSLPAVFIGAFGPALAALETIASAIRCKAGQAEEEKPAQVWVTSWPRAKTYVDC